MSAKPAPARARLSAAPACAAGGSRDGDQSAILLATSLSRPFSAKTIYLRYAKGDFYGRGPTTFFSNREYHRRALEEVFVVAAVSIVPLLLLPFIANVKAGAETPFELSAFWDAISAGQLFLYSFAMLGMIIWLSVEDVSTKPFPPRKYFIVVAILTAFLCLLVYEFDPALTKPLSPFIVRISIWIYATYLLMYYMLLVFKMLRAPPLGETVKTDVDKLIDQSRKHRDVDND